MTPWLVALLAGLALGALAVVLLLRRERSQRAALAALAARLEELEARWLESLRPPAPAVAESIAEVAPEAGEEAGAAPDPGTVPPTSDVLAGLTSHVQELLQAGGSGVELLADRAILEIYRRLAGPLTPSGLAEALYVSLRTLERGLVVALDCTPGQLIATVRMREARRLLAEGRRVSEVADELGFADPFHFSRRYKRFYGMAPSEARRSPVPLSRRG